MLVSVVEALVVASPPPADQSLEKARVYSILYEKVDALGKDGVKRKT